MERSLGGNAHIDLALRDISHLAKAPRSARVPPTRLIVRTIDRQDAYFIVPKLDQLLPG